MYPKPGQAQVGLTPMVTSAPVSSAAAAAVVKVCLKRRGILDDVIGGKHDHRGGMISERDPSRSERDRRRRVAFRRFRHDIFLGQIRQELTHGGFLVHIRQDQEAFARDQAIEPGHRLLEQRFFRDQTKELFRASPAAQRPEAFSTSSSEDERIDRIGHD